MEEWKVFLDDQGHELFAYTIQGETEGEEQATRELIAHDKKMDPLKIKTVIESR